MSDKSYGMNRVYIAGPMKDQPGHNVAVFGEIAKHVSVVGLPDTGYVAEVINPAENTYGDTRDQQEVNLRTCLLQVLSADGILLLPGWEGSEGASLEARVAKATGKVFFLATRLNGGWLIRRLPKPPAELVEGAQSPAPVRCWRCNDGFDPCCCEQAWVGEQEARYGSAPKIFPESGPKGDAPLKIGGYSGGKPLAEMGPPADVESGACFVPEWAKPVFVPPDFTVKDSGARQEYASGMVRDIQEGKPDYTLLPYEFLTRWAHHMGKAIPKYGRDNWRCANSEEELIRFRSSAFRHLIQWLNGETDEDHASAVAFNVAAAEYAKGRLEASQ